MSNAPQSLFDKLWDKHLVTEESLDRPAVIYIDLHLIHEVTSPQAFSVLDAKNLKVRRPNKTFATLDHSTPTMPADENGDYPYDSTQTREQVETLIENCEAHNVSLLKMDDPRRGIVHVIGPELGLTQPGKTIVCGDSHTSTHGAFGALAFGIGTTEVGHVLATQCLLQRKPKTMRVNFVGETPVGVTAKDIALGMIAQIGADGGQGYAIEFAGSAIEQLSMEARMTLCNMSIEAGARVGLVAPDKTTFDWLKGREYSPSGDDWYQSIDEWRQLISDEGATFDKEVTVDVAALSPMVTYGVSPDAAGPVDQPVPAQTSAEDKRAAEYMKIEEGQSFSDIGVDRVFVGSCTNSRLSDLRMAADILRGRRVNNDVVMLVVPGSVAVKVAAEAEGLDKVFINAGAQWREPGCSMCIAMNGDRGAPGELVVSTSNRNFVGRQGKGVRTVLASPATAAASAIEGRIADPRPYMNRNEASYDVV